MIMSLCKTMERLLVPGIIVIIFTWQAYGQPKPANTLSCRSCNKATNLSDCTGMVNCDNSTEACFIDELITGQLNTVYNGGCRSKSICSARRKKELVACARCCHDADDCNSDLCGIKQAHAQPKPANPLSCRSCNKAMTLSDCTEMVTCDNTTEACFIDEMVTDQLNIVYNGGCRSKSICYASGGISRHKKDLVACAKCCHKADDCNSDLCGIKQAQAHIQHRPSDNIKCKRCNDARTLSSCSGMVLCDSMEECYMEEKITDQLEIIYEGGCRSKEVCRGVASALVGKKKRTPLLSCSKCCSSSDFCNTKLCRIPS